MSEQLLPLTIDGIRLTDDNDGLNPQRSPGTGLKFGQGTITLVMGPNGAGKTRLLEMTAGLRFTEEWNISYGDERMWLRGRKSRRRRNPAALLAYGYASQSPEEQLFARSVASELRY
ncbi:ATP-binding cassette domain-containing protein, partial [Paenibacillus sepulcri]|nr:ATP-binding cassette domain-containing protein [Paenibacillus sepulcri]